MKMLKTLFISSTISFFMVFGGWMCNNWFFENSADNFWFLVLSTIWWIPGFLILSIFKGSWAVIHLERWINLTPVISFAFWVVAILGIRKVFLILKKPHKNIGE